MVTSNNTEAKRRVMSAISVVPNSGTDLTTKDSILYNIHVCNVTGSAATFTLTDKQSTPRYVLNAYSVPANSFVNIAFQEGLLMSGGVTWSAGTANALQSYLELRRKG